MKNLILLIAFVLGCSSKNDYTLVIVLPQNNDILRDLIREGKVNGSILHNSFCNEPVDSFVNLSVTYPFEQSYSIDSIFFLYYTESNLKILAQSQYEKGLIYIEIDKNGNHNRYFEFGGYVLDVYDLDANTKNKSIDLTFSTNVWGSTMPDTFIQKLKIVSHRDSINFNIYYKDSDQKWQMIENDL